MKQTWVSIGAGWYTFDCSGRVARMEDLGHNRAWCVSFGGRAHRTSLPQGSTKNPTNECTCERPLSTRFNRQTIARMPPDRAEIDGIGSFPIASICSHCL